MRRLAMAGTTTSKPTTIWKEKIVTKTTNIWLKKTLIFSIATWTLKKVDRKRIEAFELWVYVRVSSVVERT